MAAYTTKFEGPEKKLEIVLFSPQAGLRANRDGRWDKVVRASRAQIISKTSTRYLDAYLLSESSLFVWQDRIIMITCGNTTPTTALPAILGIVDKSNVELVYYQRKKNICPTKHLSNFKDDLACLEPYFPGKNYRFGPADRDHVNVFYSSHSKISTKQGTTLQVLMHDLDPAVMKIFMSSNSGTAAQAERLSGLDKIHPQTITDSYLFSPYGYSLNGISETNYFTIHVTPQPDASYASFETTIIEDDYPKIIEDIISIFRSEIVSLVLTTTSRNEQNIALHDTVVGVVPGYDLTKKTLYELEYGHAITFLSYVRKAEN